VDTYQQSSIMVNRSEFLKMFRLQTTTEFHRDGEDAQWASVSGPRFWGDEDAIIELETTTEVSRFARSRTAMAVSPDGHLLAAASSSTIRIFEIGTQKLLSELKGHPNKVGRLVFAPTTALSGKLDGTSNYALLSVCKDQAGRGQVVAVWSLNHDGCLVAAVPFRSFGGDDLTDSAMSIVGTELEREHGVTTEELASIRSALCNAIDAVEKKHRLKALPSAYGDLPTYNDTDLFSCDDNGLKVLYLSKNETTQQGMRPADELPQIVIAGLQSSISAGSGSNAEDNNPKAKGEQLETLKVLQGHTDAILSVAFSPDGKLVASASWDQTFRIWSVETGECLRSIGPTGAQNWAVAFTPTGEHVVLSGGGRGRDEPSPVALYSTATGEEVSRLRHPDLDAWLRVFAIHPDGKSAAVINGISLLLWDFTQTSTDEGYQPSNAIEVLKLANPEDELETSQIRMFRNFASLVDVSWVDGGKKLLVRANDNTVFVWDQESNVKWRLQRPEGIELPNYDTDFAYVEDGDSGTIISLDGDMKVRFWKL
jgi:WD40 repeat protein